MFKMSPTCDKGDGGNDPPLLEMGVSLRVHHQQPGLISAFLDEGHHVSVPHSLDVCAIDLTNTPRQDKHFLRKWQERYYWLCPLVRNHRATFVHLVSFLGQDNAATC